MGCGCCDGAFWTLSAQQIHENAGPYHNQGAISLLVASLSKVLELRDKGYGLLRLDRKLLIIVFFYQSVQSTLYDRNEPQ